MAGDAIIEMRPNPRLKPQVHDLWYQSVKEVFELDIKPQAVANSPVTEEGLQRNEALGRKRPGGTGTNRRSIDTEVKQTPDGVKATLFTQSGYGGWLEIGTRYMRAQPYLYPAYVKFKNKFAQVMKRKVASENG